MKKLSPEQVEKEVHKILKDNGCGFQILYKQDGAKLAFKIKVKKLK